jgi:hypothetical protein
VTAITRHNTATGYRAFSRLDEGISHRDSVAKKAAAFFYDISLHPQPLDLAAKRPHFIRGLESVWAPCMSADLPQLPA